MKYVIYDEVAGELLSVFDADSLADAVAKKQQVQTLYNQRHGIDQVLTVREATRREIRRFKPAGFVVVKR